MTVQAFFAGREDFERVAMWIAANAPTLLAYREGELSTVEFVMGMTRV